jgi:DNA-binding NtrC family response regulator
LTRIGEAVNFAEWNVQSFLDAATAKELLEALKGNKAETARILQVDYKTLYRKMYRYFGTFSDIIIQPYPNRELVSDDS